MKKIFLLLVALGVSSTVAFANIIKPTYLPGNSTPNAFSSPDQMINDSGLSATVPTGTALASALSVTHIYDGNYQESYVSNASGADYFAAGTPPVLVFDLGADEQIGSLVLWQYQNNGGGPTSAGNATRTLDVRINTSAQGSSSFSGGASTLTLLPVLDADGTGGNDLGGTNSAQEFSYAATGRYLQLTLTDNYRGFQGVIGGGDRVGLGELRVSTIPEPTSLGLILLSGMLLLARRRTRC